MLKRIHTFGKNARNWLKEGIQLDELKNVSNDDQKMLEERIFFSVGERLTKYFRMRILWVPGMFIAFVVVIFFLGLESWVKSTVEDVVEQEARASLDSLILATTKTLDSLVSESSESVKEQKSVIEYNNNQFQLIMRQYESLLPYFAVDARKVRDIYDPAPDIKQMYDSLKQDEG
ncbi:MAG: hypothetical protein IIA17_11720, partial [candidate division Zixibacteria bacterium]|nr:hypothetical protein [candidate division Zixibacteria bacterium]